LLGRKLASAGRETAALAGFRAGVVVAVMLLIVVVTVAGVRFHDWGRSRDILGQRLDLVGDTGHFDGNWVKRTAAAAEELANATRATILAASTLVIITILLFLTLLRGRRSGVRVGRCLREAALATRLFTIDELAGLLFCC
jgi:hypothetical protein